MRWLALLMLAALVFGHAKAKDGVKRIPKLRQYSVLDGMPSNWAWAVAKTIKALYG